MGWLEAANPVLGCPGRDILVDFDLGKLPEATLAAVAEHVSSCERCEQILEALQEQGTDDRVLARVRACLVGPSPPEPPALAGIEAIGGTVLATTEPQERSDRDGAPGPAADTVADKMFGPYELRQKLGQGGMGVVYLARQVPLNRMVALKMILAGHHAGAKLVDRFVREGKTVAMLRHRNVVQVYELGEHEGLPYYSMELVEGGSLHARLAAGPLEPREAAEIVRTLAGAVAYAHQQNVIHRDLKPSNILLDRDGTPRITDYGIAKLLDTDSEPDGATTAQLTESGDILGTPSYMSPEQAVGSRDIGPATDVYSLGAILYEALTGRPPFQGATRVQTLELVRTAPPARPSSVRPGIPFALEQVCLKCLEKSPALRYPSAQALADDLGLWLDGEYPIGIPGWLTRLKRFVRRHLAAVVTFTAMIPVGAWAGAVGVSAYRNNPNRVIGRIETELAHRRPVTLIGEFGAPRWSKWICGGKEGHWFLADDGAFTVQSLPLGLVELLTGTHSGSYRITAQVRHEESDLEGDVGLYLARKAYPWAKSDLHFFTQLTFNDVRGDAERLARLPIEVRPSRPPRDNVVVLYPRLVSDETMKPFMDWGFLGTSGPRFRPRGTKKGFWHDLEVTVTPGNVTARWNDHPPFTMTHREIQEGVTRILSAPPSPAGASRPGFIPAFSTGGGLGLYVRKGSASFRSVTVTPLD
jgi:serine/threonine-protein kinase